MLVDIVAPWPQFGTVAVHRSLVLALMHTSLHIAAAPRIAPAPQHMLAQEHTAPAAHIEPVLQHMLALQHIAPAAHIEPVLQHKWPPVPFDKLHKLVPSPVAGTPQV